MAPTGTIYLKSQENFVSRVIHKGSKWACHVAFRCCKCTYEAPLTLQVKVCWASGCRVVGLNEMGTNVGLKSWTPFTLNPKP